MEIGTGIAIGGSIIGAVAIIFKIFGDTKSTHNQCSQHYAIVAKFEDMNTWLEKIESKLDRVIERRGESR